LKKNVVCVGAHPDDEMPCAGTLAKMAKQGHNVYICCVTNGDKGYFDLSVSAEELAARRLEELKAAAKVIGAKDFVDLGYLDGEVLLTPSLRADITKNIRKWKASVVFTHDPWRTTEASLDHINVGLMTCHVGVYSGFPHFHSEQLKDGIEPQRVEEFYLFGSSEPNFYSDITETIDQKINSRLCHESQITQALTPLDEKARQMLEQRLRRTAAICGKHIGVEYAEEFKAFSGGSGHFDWFPQGVISK